MPPPASSFRAKARNPFRSRSGKRGGDDGSRETPCTLRRGMPIRERTVSHSFSFRLGSEPPPLRGTSFQGKEGVCRLPASSFRAKARNPFRSRSGKRGEDGGSRETSHSLRRGITVLHADSFTKENGNGKRKRSLDCARDDNTREDVSHSFSTYSVSQPPPLRGTSFQGKEGVCRLPHRHSRLLTTSFLWMSQAGIIAASVPTTVTKGMIRSPRGSGAVSITTAA